MNVPFYDQNFWKLIDALGTSLGILTAFAAFYTLFILWRSERKWLRISKNLNQSTNDDLPWPINIETTFTARPMALGINVLPGKDSMEVEIQNYFKALGMEVEIPYREINIDGINDIRVDIPQFSKELRDQKNLIDKENYTEVNLFIAGPINLGVIAGAMLDNWKLVKIYGKATPNKYNKDPQKKFYEFWCSLSK